MKGNRRKLFSFLVALSMIFSIILSSVTCYADIERPGKYQAAVSNRPAYKEGELLVKFKDGTSSKIKAAFASENGMKKIKSFDSVNIGLYSVKKGMSTQKAVRELLKSEDIEYVQPNYLYYPSSVPSDPYYDNLWGLNNDRDPEIDIDAPEAWDITRGENDIIVAVIDTGIDINHPELSGRIWENTGETAGNGIDDDGNGFIDDIYGWDFYSNDNSVFDDEIDDEHGTHVAGTIAAEANTEGVIGVAPGVKIMPLKFLGYDGGSTDDAIAAISYAKRMGAKLINASWGGLTEYDQALKEAIDQSGMLFVAAAGNSGINIDVTPDYPASFNSSNILTVAAVEEDGDVSYFSNYGEVSVDVGAPGRSIFSTVTDGVYGIAAVGVTGSTNAFVAAFGIEELSQPDADDLLSKALDGIGHGTPILLVDDDGNDLDYYDDVYSVYDTALTNLGYTNVDIFDVYSDISDGPNYWQMSPYDVVVWFTGQTYGEFNEDDDWVTTLTYNDQMNLMDYLDAGKTLIIFGQDAFCEIEDSYLVNNYLGIDISLSDYGRNHLIEGAAGTVFDSVYYEIPTGHYYYRDHIEPIAEDAEALLYYPESDGAYYDYMSGTSMAAPHVTGIAALLLSKNSDLTAAQLKSAIMNSGTSLAELTGTTSTGKLVNAFNALKAVAPAAPANLAASKSGSNVTLTWTGREAGDFKQYIVERSIDGASYSAVKYTTSKSFIDYGIDTSKTYRYRIKAEDDYGNISCSSSVTGNSISTGGGGGGGGGGGTAAPVPNPAVDSKIEAALKNAGTGTNIEVPLVKINNIDSATMKTMTIESLAESGKALTLTGSSANITIPSAALMTEEVKQYMNDSTTKLSINVKETKGEEADILAGSTAAGMFRIGDRIFEFTAELKTSSDTVNINKFTQELKVSIKLNAEETAGIDTDKLGVYYYNAEKKVWEYAGGVFDEANNTITFDTGHFSQYVVMRAESTYTDIDKHWAKPEIELMETKHIIEAGASRQFGPDENITRAEIVKMLVNVLRYNPEKNIELITPAAATFKDVEIGRPDFSYIETAVKLGITKGKGDGTFGPDDTVTREQLTTMIIRAMEIETDSDASILTFDDKGSIPEWAAESIIAAYERGLVMGIGGNKFGVGSTATRAQAAVIIKRVMEKSGLLQVPEKLTGKLVISDIEGQHFELETEEGIYVLIHDIESKYLAKFLSSSVGKNVEVSGYAQSGFNIYQRGTVFKVISVKVN